MKSNCFLIILLITILLSCKETVKQNQQNSKIKEVSKVKEIVDTDESSIKNTDEERINRATQVLKRVDSINKSLNWEATKSELWKSKNGDLGFKRFGGFQELLTEVYITRFISGKPLAEVVDLSTFKSLKGSSYYKDKNHVYVFHDMAGGGRTWVLEDVDVLSFKTIGNCYAKDKKYIYGEIGNKLEEADYKTFKSCDDCRCYAKDKNGFYYHGRKENVDDITDKETLAIIKKLNASR